MKSKLLILSLFFSILSFNKNGELGFNKLNAQCLGGGSGSCDHECCQFNEMMNALNNYIATEATGGESFGEESTDNESDEGWAAFDLNMALLSSNSPIGGSTFGGFLNDYGDPFAGLYTPDELLNMLIHNNSLNFYAGSYVQQTGTTPTPPGDAYYITVGSDTTKYYKGNKIFIKQNTSTVLFRLKSVSGGTITKDSLRWYIDTTFKTGNTLVMNYLPNTINIIEQKLRIIDTSNKVLIDNPIVVYDKPIIYFERKDGYDGEYGFDDEGHKYDSVAKKVKYSEGYVIKNISGDANYYVPWMSLLDSQSVRIKLRKIGFQTMPDTSSIFPVTFKSSNSSKIKINNSDTISFTKNQIINQDTLNISATQFALNDSLYKKEVIYVLGNNGDTLGKLHLSCIKTKQRKAILVHVNTGSGYNPVTKAAFLGNINKYHRQFFREWVLGDSLPYTVAGHDTLNCTTDAIANPYIFSNDQLLFRIDSIYFAHKGIDIYDINGGPNNSNLDIHNKFVYIFIMNYDLPSVGGGRTLGYTATGGCKSVLWGSSVMDDTPPHEIGHALKLQHTFSDLKPDGSILRRNYMIPSGTTQNLLDYSTNQNRFYYAQWVDIHKK